ncbi:hypothetical protein IPJ72_03540 [Candidatus Peregrinibacteria bacterium]|nr:MAG: hypothetical protein IPJ72_03540 [Candidatus Peregrinibacteria bacterium]
MYPSTLKSFGHDVVELFTELDGTFPNHIADPIVESNLEVLKQKVVEEAADLGLAFDGDGDRVGVIDQKGRFINADLTMMLLSKDALSRHPGSPIISTVSNSQVLFDLIEQWGGKPVMSKVGHSYVESEMSAQHAILGGEQSGHFFLFENYFHYDDALLTAIRILKILSDSGRTISELYDAFPKTYAEPEMRPDCPDDVKFEIIQKVTTHFKDQYPCVTIDGIRLDFGNGGWAGIRASNTSPKLSITMEAESESALNQIKQVVLSHLKAYPEIQWH